MLNINQQPLIKIDKIFRKSQMKIFSDATIYKNIIDYKIGLGKEFELNQYFSFIKYITIQSFYEKYRVLNSLNCSVLLTMY
jgi:hypothetical protein